MDDGSVQRSIIHSNQDLATLQGVASLVLFVKVKKIACLGRQYSWPKPIFCSRCSEKLRRHGFVLSCFSSVHDGIYLRRLRCSCCGPFTVYGHTVISADFAQVSLRFWPVFFTGTGKNVVTNQGGAKCGLLFERRVGDMVFFHFSPKRCFVNTKVICCFISMATISMQSCYDGTCFCI